MSTKTRAIAYARVSTSKQGDNGLSLEAQIKKMRQYASIYDIELVDVIVEVGSAKTVENRPMLKAALERLNTNDADALLIHKLDRLTRSIKDLATLIEGPFSAGKKGLFSVSDHIDTRTANGIMMLNLLMTVAQWERMAISERTQVAMDLKKAKGERVGRPRFGYRVVDGKVVENPDEQEVLSVVRELRVQGLTMRATADELITRGIRGKTGNPYSPAQICEMLKQAA